MQRIREFQRTSDYLGIPGKSEYSRILGNSSDSGFSGI